MKQKYQTPCTEVISMQNEGIMAASVNTGGNLDNIGGGGTMYGTGNSSGNGAKAVQNANPLQDLEDMINDILTVNN